MTREEKLKRYIINRYGSLSNFSKKSGVNQPTLSTIFKRGLLKTTTDKFIKICEELDISGDDLLEGRIITKKQMNEPDKELLSKINLLSDYSKGLVNVVVDYQLQNYEFEDEETDSHDFLIAASGLPEKMTEEQKEALKKDIEETTHND